MKLFSFKRNNVIYSPIEGSSVALKKVPDNIFASGLMGNGIAFMYDSDVVCSPCYGEVVMIAKTKHAIGLKMNNGAEILVHIGIDTVNLKGKGFTVLVKLHQKVKPQMELIRLDRAYMKKNNINLITSLVVTNSKDYYFIAKEKEKLDIGEKLFEITRNDL